MINAGVHLEAEIKKPQGPIIKAYSIEKVVNAAVKFKEKNTGRSHEKQIKQIAITKGYWEYWQRIAQFQAIIISQEENPAIQHHYNKFGKLYQCNTIIITEFTTQLK